MAIAVDSTTAVFGQGSSSTTLTRSHTVGTGSDRILFAAVACRSTNTVSSVTYAGNAMTLVHEVNLATIKKSVWYIVAPTSGTNNIVVTINAANTGICVGAVSFTGASQTGVPDVIAADSSQTTTTAYSRAITTVADNCWIFYAGRANGGATLTAGADTTISSQPEVAVAGLFHMRSTGAKTPAGATSVACTSVSQGFDGLAVSFAPASAPVSNTGFSVWL